MNDAARMRPAVEGKKIPCATYRLQFNRGFTFGDATALVDYLDELGVTDCYASPLFKARAESTHGYDVCDFNQFNPNLGGREDFDQLAAKLQKHGMGLIVDLVPNHMASDLSNDWWSDVLQNGHNSHFASYFDIDWQPLKSDLHDKVILPILEDHYAKVLENGKLRLAFENSAFVITYYDKKFPVTSRSYTSLLQELDSSPPEEKQSLLQNFNGKAGSPESFDRLHHLLQEQHYRLAYWKVGPEEINYRRFFDVNELVSVRMELPDVFKAANQLIFQLIKDGAVTGLRIDHPDGLWNPEGYLRRLQEDCSKPSLYIVAEKILTQDEPLPKDWPVDGTTGYDFLNRANGLFVHSENERIFDTIYRDFTGTSLDFAGMAYSSKKRILEFSLASELNALTHRLKRVAVGTRYGQDFTFRQLHASLAEVIASFPVYRTYITEKTREVSAIEKEHIEQAMAGAKARNPKMDQAVFEFIKNLLLLQSPADMNDITRQRSREFVMKFQQLTGPVMAKGVEDTAFYNFNRLISLNEVGGSPEEFGTSVGQFHQYNASKQEQWPHSMLSTSTHDTKRGEDARARINVLSEIPAEWRETLGRWSRLNQKRKVDGRPAPDLNDEYLLYQTLVGAWPDEAKSLDGLISFRERVLAYMFKALRESKTHTSWNDPNTAYENAVKEFIIKLLDNSRSNPFLDDFKRFQQRVAFFGLFNSLAQILLKMTAPGVPDLYQGAELWDFSLVDPDNRRPIDFKSRRRLLMDLKDRLQKNSDVSTFLKQLLETSHTGEIKLFTTYCTLHFRRQHRDLFKNGSYVPLIATGKGREHICSFARIYENHGAITVVPRLVATLNEGAERSPMGMDVWKDTWLILPQAKPGGKLRNVFTNESITIKERNGEFGVALGDVLADFPVALLTNAGEEPIHS
jgi:(1->4)-alpha-D-glucan 1-alpha-D-glucosylmutase